MIVVSDTGPLHYLALIGALDVLPAICGDVHVPRHIVVTELADPSTPKLVRAIYANPPRWVNIHGDPPVMDKSLIGLGLGESLAISLLLQMGGDLLLCDDLAARNRAKALRISVMGTLGLIDEAACRRLLDFERAMDRLTHETNFRHSPVLIEAVRATHMARMQGGKGTV